MYIQLFILLIIKLRQFFCLVSVEEFLQKPVTVPNEVDNLVFQGKLQGIGT